MQNLKNKVALVSGSGRGIGRAIALKLARHGAKIVVNDVDVTAFVEGELDRRHPERVQLREMRTAGDYRAMWDRIELLWAETVARAGRLPEPALHQRVDGEWSFTETLRHLILATDKWAGYMILDKPAPYHPLGLPQPGFTPADAAELGIDLDARPPVRGHPVSFQIGRDGVGGDLLRVELLPQLIERDP